MRKIFTIVLISIFTISAGCGIPSKVEVGMTIDQAHEIMQQNDSKELELTADKWDKSTWRVFVMPDKTCVEFFCENAQNEIITNIIVGEKGEGYWINDEEPKNTEVEIIDVDDYEKED